VAEDIVIRQAVPQDGPALIAAIGQIDEETEFLGVPGQRHPWADQPAAELRSLAENNRGVVYLALSGDAAIVGYLSAFAGYFIRNRGTIFIAVVGLRERYRGRGIGARLFERIEAWARARQAWRLELRVSSLNPRGLALYHKCGFAIEGRIRAGVFRQGAWTDDFWMGKLLDPLPADALDVENTALGRVGIRPTATAGLSLRPMRPGDGTAFRAWDLRVSKTLPFALRQPSEIPSVEAIERDIASLTTDPRLWSVALAPSRRGDDRIVGFASVGIEFGYRMQHDAFVNVAVEPGWSAHGLGRRLHDGVEAWAREHGARRLTATVQAPNSLGRRFAAALGYEEDVVMRRYSLIEGRMIDRLRLGKLLTD